MQLNSQKKTLKELSKIDLKRILYISNFLLFIRNFFIQIIKTSIKVCIFFSFNFFLWLSFPFYIWLSAFFHLSSPPPNPLRLHSFPVNLCQNLFFKNLFKYCLRLILIKFSFTKQFFRYKFWQSTCLLIGSI